MIEFFVIVWNVLGLIAKLILGAVLLSWILFGGELKTGYLEVEVNGIINLFQK